MSEFGPQPDPPASSEVFVSAFGITEPMVLLDGGEGRTYRVGERVYRREADPVEAAYIAELHDGLVERDFRVPRPVRNRAGRWLSADGWSAWTFLAGRPASPHDLPQIIKAVQAFHEVLAGAEHPEYLARRDSPYDRADRAVWGEIPPETSPQLAPLVAELCRRRRPVGNLVPQLIHGDLNEGNILVDTAAPPAIIDIAPYWRPPEFALAVLAYWLGPYRGDESILTAFAAVREFDQMLIRAALRTVLISHEFSKLGRSLVGIEKQHCMPVEIVLNWMDRRAE